MDFSLPRAEIEQLAGRVSDEQAELLTRYAEAIVQSSGRVNLISRRSLDELPMHIVDSAALLSFVEPGSGDLADLGSGAGFPGLVAAVLRPAALVTLVDSRRSKVVFLKDVLRRLGLENVEVLHARLEDLEGQRKFELATARALGAVRAVLPHCLRLVGPGGRLVLFKGPEWSVEADGAAAIAESAGAEVVRTEAVPLPGQGRTTTFVEFHVKHDERSGRAPE